ncbi:MAG TPA: hypothetical protein VKA46_19455 [Gemmataceae bacterium]|nr:hypothetical protein [Gemmataceae bacterium]
MAGRKATVPLKVGDRVKLHYYGKRGRVVELRGPLGPGGKLVYRVIVSRKPRPVYIDLTEDQVVLITPANSSVKSPQFEPRENGEHVGHAPG